MIYRLTVLLFLFTNICPAYSQNKCDSFILNGFINADTGKIVLLAINNFEYYPTNIKNKEIQIKSGHFILSNFSKYPYGFRIGLMQNLQWIYLSDVFFIEPCTQSIKCNIDSIRRIPEIFNSSTTELSTEYNKFNLKYPNNDRNQILLKYAKEFPNSYVSLWKLVDNLSSGYEAVLDSVYFVLSDSLKNTYTGKILKQKLMAARSTIVGSKFSINKTYDIQNKLKNITYIYKKNKLTLVDFWFSHCAPCIGQFDELNTLYRKYHAMKFEIIGISIDGPKEVNDWKKVIKKYKLPWLQLLDKNGIEAKKISILAFPTNFLIDKNGIILKKNILPSELASYLESFKF